MNPKSYRRSLGMLVMGLSICGAAGSASAVVADDSGSIVDVTTLVGVNRFYQAGYTGTRTVATVLDYGHLWNGHESLAHVQTFFNATGLTTPPGAIGSLGDFDYRATAAAHILGGHGTPAAGDADEGIAPNTTLWSGAVALGWESPSSFFPAMTHESFVTPLHRAMFAGVEGRRTDVVSLGVMYGAEGENSFNAGSPAATLDAMIYSSGATVVTTAENFGPFSYSIGGTSADYNVLTVGGLAMPRFDSLSFFSGRGPSDYYNPVTGQTLEGVRATVDILAPGDSIRAALYAGATGQASGQDAPDPLPTDSYVSTGPNALFAAPIAAGGAALLVDAGYDRFGGGAAIDGRVIKAVLMNAADRHGFAWIPWNNGLSVDGAGVLRTTQSLDPENGAGRLNLDRAFDQYTAGTTDLPGLTGGRAKAIGWDFGRVEKDSFTDYYFDTELAAGEEVSATLNWWIERYATFTELTSGNVTASDDIDDSFINLDLQLWRLTGRDGELAELIASSESLYNNVEMFMLNLPADGYYMLRVVWAGLNYDQLDPEQHVDFALAWAVPEPASLLVLLIGSLAATRRVHRP